MADFVMPSIKDIEQPPVPENEQAAEFANPALEDMGMVTPTKPIPYDWGNSTLKFANVDTGVKLPPRAEQFLVGMGRAFTNAGRSAKQLVGKYPEEQAKRDALLDLNVNNTGWGGAGDVAGTIAMSALIPQGGLASALGGGAAKLGAAKLGASLAGSAITDAALTGALQSQLRPTLGDETRLGNAAREGTSAAAFTAALKPVSALVGKTINSVRNVYKNPEAQRIDDLARQYGIDLTIGDLPQHTAWRHFEDATAGVPFSGRTANMEKQVGQMQDMLYSLRENLRPDLTVVDPAGSVLAKYTTPDEMMVGEIQRNFKNLTSQKDKLFENVSQEIAKNPAATKVDFNETKKAVATLMKSHPKIFKNFEGVDAQLPAKLSFLEKDLDNMGRNAQGQFSAKASYDDAQWLRENLGSMVEQARKKAQSGNLSEKAYGQLKQVYKAVNMDLDKWGANPKNTNVHESYKTAQNFYKENILPFKQHPVLKKVVNEFAPYDSDVALKEFFKPGRANVAKDLMKFQTPEGRRAAEFAMIDDVVEKTVTNKDVDISKFLSTVKKLEKPSKEVFSPHVAKQVDDLSEIFSAANRAENFLNTGPGAGRYAAIQAARTLGPWIAGGAVAGAGMGGGLTSSLATGSLLAGLVGASRGLNAAGINSTGKRILLSSSELPGGLRQVTNYLINKGAGPISQEVLGEADLQPFLDYVSPENARAAQ